MPNSINDITSYYLGSSSTCTGKIARVFAVISFCSFILGLSGTIASAHTYFSDSKPETEYSTTVLPSLPLQSLAAFALSIISSASAFAIGYGLCDNCNVHSSSSNIVVVSPGSSLPLHSSNTCRVRSISLPSKLASPTNQR